MGKAALLMVLGAGMFVAYGTLSTQETSHHTAKTQASYEKGVLAREIARTGFNVAMGILRQHGDSLQYAVNLINDGGYLEGESQGGVYRATANYVSGYSVEVASTGYFGGEFAGNGQYKKGAVHVMEDNFTYSVPTNPGHVQQCSRLKSTFIQSEAGFCSAVFMKRYLPDGSEGEPEMLVAAGHNRNNSSHILGDTLLAGTQLNFFIGVDENCSEQPERHGVRWQDYDVENHEFDADDYDHVHYAFNLEEDDLFEIDEAVWGLVEQHPADNQKWRIAWEDQHRTDWDNPNTNDPRQSLQATKAYGYSGTGWPRTDSRGYRTLSDFGSQPDFSDQVIEIELEPVACPGTPPPCPCQHNRKKVLVKHFPQGNHDNPQEICIAQEGWENGHDRHTGDYIMCVNND